MKLFIKGKKNTNYYRGKIDKKIIIFSINKYEKVPRTIEEIISAKARGKIKYFNIEDFNLNIDSELLATVIKYGGSYRNEKCEIRVALENNYFNIEYKKENLIFYNSLEEGPYFRERITYVEMLGIITAVQNNKNNRTKDYKKIEKMFEIFNLLERKEEFGYVKKNENIFEIFEKVSKTKIIASENYCIFEKSGVIEAIAIQNKEFKFDKPLGIFKGKINFLYDNKILEIKNGKVKYQILEAGHFSEEVQLSKRKTKIELLNLYQKLENSNIIKNIEEINKIINEKLSLNEEEKEIFELSTKISKINL